MMVLQLLLLQTRMTERLVVAGGVGADELEVDAAAAAGIDGGASAADEDDEMLC